MEFVKAIRVVALVPQQYLMPNFLRIGTTAEEILRVVAYAHSMELRLAVAPRLAVAQRKPLALQQPAHLVLGILQLPQIQAWRLGLAALHILVRAKQ